MLQIYINNNILLNCCQQKIKNFLPNFLFHFVQSLVRRMTKSVSFFQLRLRLSIDRLTMTKSWLFFSYLACEQRRYTGDGDSTIGNGSHYLAQTLSTNITGGKNTGYRGGTVLSGDDMTFFITGNEITKRC